MPRRRNLRVSPTVPVAVSVHAAALHLRVRIYLTVLRAVLDSGKAGVLVNAGTPSRPLSLGWSVRTGTLSATRTAAEMSADRLAGIHDATARPGSTAKPARRVAAQLAAADPSLVILSPVDVADHQLDIADALADARHTTGVRLASLKVPTLGGIRRELSGAARGTTGIVEYAGIGDRVTGADAARVQARLAEDSTGTSVRFRVPVGYPRSKRVDVWTDASYKDGVFAGAATVSCKTDTSVVVVSSRPDTPVISSLAGEVAGIVAAVRIFSATAEHVVVRTDSRQAIRLAGPGAPESDDPATEFLRRALRCAVNDARVRGTEVELRWTPAHTGRRNANERADRMAGILRRRVERGTDPDNLLEYVAH
jgi:ribonuclease HI